MATKSQPPKTIMVTDPSVIQIVYDAAQDRGFPGQNPQMLSTIVREWSASHTDTLPGPFSPGTRQTQEDQHA